MGVVKRREQAARHTCKKCVFRKGERVARDVSHECERVKNVSRQCEQVDRCEQAPALQFSGVCHK